MVEERGFMWWWRKSIGVKMKDYLPHLLMILSLLGLAIFIVCVQSFLSGSGGVSGPVFVFYQHIVSTFLLFILSFIFERKRKPPLTWQIVGWAFLLGFLQITLCQLLLTSSLRYITATFQTVALNTSMPLLFILAVIFRQETFHFCSINGQGKLWGIIVSVGGATLMLLWSGPDLQGSPPLNELPGIEKRVIGSIMIASALLASNAWNLLVGGVATRYPAEISLSAMMTLSGTVLTGVIAAITERNTTAWKIVDGLELPSILYGGIVTTGLAYYVQTWCVHKKGPVFASAFSPLLIVFSFLLETFIFKKATHLGSIIGTVLVVVGLYVLLWAKAEDEKNKAGVEETTTVKDPFIDHYDRLS